MARIILVSSLKGGVGNSTVCANLAAKLARAGHKTLLCDLDLGLGTLDIITGCEDRMLFDVCDAAFGRRAAGECAVSFSSPPGLFLLGAPYRAEDAADSPDFPARIRYLCEGCDYALLDAPLDGPASAAACACADEAIIVTTQDPASVRGAAKSAEILREKGVDCRLVINRFDAQAVCDGRRDGMLSIIDAAKTPLLGVIPYDRALDPPEKGGFAEGDTFVSSRAFENVAGRLNADRTGQQPAPILQGVRGISPFIRKKVLTK